MGGVRAGTRLSLQLQLLMLAVAIHAAWAHLHLKPFQMGDSITLQCKNEQGKWEPLFMCDQTGEPLSFRFGEDAFMNCGLKVNDEPLLEKIKKAIAQEQSINCRIPMSSDHSFFIPVHFPMWGVIERAHIHVNNHINLLFHAGEGRIMGASIYPISDNFQITKINTVIQFHGHVRWFYRHSYEKGVMNKQSFLLEADTTSILSTVGWCLLTALITSLALGLYYMNILRPAIIKKYLKHD